MLITKPNELIFVKIHMLSNLSRVFFYNKTTKNCANLFYQQKKNRDKYAFFLKCLASKVEIILEIKFIFHNYFAILL